MTIIEASKKNPRAPVLPPTLADRYFLKDLLTGEYLHLSGDRITDKKQYRWEGTRPQADALRAKQRVAAGLTIFKIIPKETRTP